MRIGMSAAELSRMFDSIYNQEFDNNQFPMEGMRRQYEIQGIPAPIAKELVKLTFKQMAVRRAVLSVIEANNGRIQSQLEQTGIDL